MKWGPDRIARVKMAAARRAAPSGRLYSLTLRAAPSCQSSVGERDGIYCN
jgi:hypothetical protein